jgi:thiamine transporter
MSSEQLQAFFQSTIGQIAVVAVILILFTGILISGKGKKVDTSALVTSAILVALALALNQIVLFRMPQGGSVTAFSMLPIVLCAQFFGLRRGLMAGMCVGLIDLIFNPYVIHPVQMILDYPLAYGALAFAALIPAKKAGIIPSYLVGVLGRYACAVMSGIIFFGQYAPEGFNAITWSLWYNLTYLAAEGGLTIAVLLIPGFRKGIYRLKDRIS